MKKVLLFLTLLCSLNIFSQNQLIVPKYTTQHILRLEVQTPPFEFTIKSRLNDNAFSDFNKYTMNDPFGWGAYDIKLKYFLSPKVHFVQRIFVTGLTRTNYFMMFGIDKKF